MMAGEMGSFDKDLHDIKNNIAEGMSGVEQVYNYSVAAEHRRSALRHGVKETI